MGPIALRRPSDEKVIGVWEQQSSLPITYKNAGMTRGGPHRGYRHHRATVSLGVGTFEKARDAVRSWGAQRGAGFGVHPERPVAQGMAVLVYGRLGPLYTSVCCRVIYIVDEDDRWGFAYGTLPHHVERGEESFIVSKDKDDNVTFTVESLSRPATVVARLGSPIARAIQARITRRYLEALQRSVAT
ncbi:MAG TPA: DUF1990 domain-containing protein [Actinomycetota bacterium]|nr:DUF1990 domain-containing protein [Actinomycetota bacterium]